MANGDSGSGFEVSGAEDLRYSRILKTVVYLTFASQKLFEDRKATGGWYSKEGPSTRLSLNPAVSDFNLFWDVK